MEFRSWNCRSDEESPDREAVNLSGILFYTISLYFSFEDNGAIYFLSIFAYCLPNLTIYFWQKSARLKLPVQGKPTLLHLPLSFPMASESSHLLTAWSTVTLNLPSLMPRFSDMSLLGDDDDASRSLGTVAVGTFSHVSYVKIYSTCRLRRIWFSQEGPGADLPWEFQLYSDA